MSLKECIRHMKFICEQGVLRNKSIILNKTFQRELLNIIKHYEELEEENFNLRENIYIEKKSFPSDGRNIEELIEMPTYEELQQENQKYKEVIDKAINNSQYWIDYYTRLNSDERIALRLQENIDILKEVE